MITQLIIDQIKEFSKNVSPEKLKTDYFIALGTLSEEELIIIRDSYVEESKINAANFDNIQIKLAI